MNSILQYLKNELKQYQDMWEFDHSPYIMGKIHILHKIISDIENNNMTK